MHLILIFMNSTLQSILFHAMISHVHMHILCTILHDWVFHDWVLHLEYMHFSLCIITDWWLITDSMQSSWYPDILISSFPSFHVLPDIIAACTFTHPSCTLSTDHWSLIHLEISLIMTHHWFHYPHSILCHEISWVKYHLSMIMNPYALSYPVVHAPIMKSYPSWCMHIPRQLVIFSSQWIQAVYHHSLIPHPLVHEIIDISEFISPCIGIRSCNGRIIESLHRISHAHSSSTQSILVTRWVHEFQHASLTGNQSWLIMQWVHHEMK